MRTALVPGTFDPVTLGHLDLIIRAAGLFDRVVVGVLVNTRKASGTPAEERVRAILEALAEDAPAIAARVEVIADPGLTVALARKVGAQALVRGVRGAVELEAEQALAAVNRRLDPGIETVLLMAAPEHAGVSSTLVREVAALGGDLAGLVPGAAARRLRRSAGEGGGSP